MTLKEMKKIILGLIEELNPDSEYLTDDPDIQAKINDVINLIQLELARMKKISAYTTENVAAEQVFDLNTIDKFYQLRLLRFKNEAGQDAEYEIVENMVIFNQAGTATIFYYKYPEDITDKTSDEHVLELSQDALGIMPYGVAGDLLKSDVSTNYGAIYSQKYETMLQRLDPRYSMGSISVEGGVNI